MSYTCEICQYSFSSEIEFFKHLDTHSRKEVETLRQIVLKKMNMTEEEKKRYDLELAIKGLNLA
jgi:hypothetical protein